MDAIRKRRFFLPSLTINFIPALYVANLIVLWGSMLVAVQLRLKLTQGKILGADYHAHSITLYCMIALILAGIHLVHQRLGHVSPTTDSPYCQAIELLAASFASVAAILGLFPNLSQLQVLYFIMVAVLLNLLVVVWPIWMRRSQSADSLQTDLMRLWNSRGLLALWLRYNIQSRYSQTILGILWIILLPLATASVLTIAFTQFLRIKLDVPFITFFLAALVPFNLFSGGVQHSTNVIIGKMRLINQVYFPREILVIIAVGEALVDLMFTFVAMLVINAINGFWPNELFVLLPVSLLILLTFTLGLMLFVSSLSVMVRDIPQLVGVVLQLMFYMTPIIYPIDRFPQNYRWLILFNPIAPVIQSFRDIIVYHQSPDPLMLYYPLVAGLSVLYMGYTFFKANEHRFADLQ